MSNNTVGLRLGSVTISHENKNAMVIGLGAMALGAAFIWYKRNRQATDNSPSVEKVTESNGYLRAIVPSTSVLSDDDLDATVDAAKRIGVKPEYLLAVISFESAGSFSPSKQNAESKATGLIQFMPRTAKNMGTTIDDLAKMSYKEQLEYVVRYFAPHKGRLNRLEDIYAAVLWPLAIGKPDSYVLFKFPSIEYRQNYGLDPKGSGNADIEYKDDSAWTGGPWAGAGRKGYVTLSDAAKSVRARLRAPAAADYGRSIVTKRGQGILIGDSLAEGMGPSAKKENWLVSARRGTTIAQWLDTLPDVRGLDVIVSLGTNDAASTAGIDSIIGRARELISRLKKGGASSITWAIPSDAARVKRIGEVRDGIIKVGEKEGINVIDAAPSDGMAPDGIHYTPKAYAAWWEGLRASS